MNKVISAIGKKNIIIISGILLIGVAVYLNLNLSFVEYDGNYFASDHEWDDSRILGQASLVGNLGSLSAITDTAENMGVGAGGGPLNAEDLSVVDEPRDNYFAISVVSRQRARDESIELLSNIVNHADALPDVRYRALNDIAVIAREIEREANIEALVRAKGFTDCVAVVNGDNANIIVQTDGLMPNEVAQIKEIVFEQAGILPMNVKIIERN